MKRTQLLPKTFCAIALFFVSQTLPAAELVVDGGFESPAPATSKNFGPAWTNVDPSAGGPFSGVDRDTNPPFMTGPTFANSGNAYAFLGARSTSGSLFQTLNTAVGGNYTLSFFLANDDSRPTNFFSVFFNGLQIFTTMSPPFDTTGNYTQFMVAGLLATGSSTVLEFRYRHDGDFFRLDDVSVQGPAGTVPELGSTVWLALPALTGLCLLHFFGLRTRRVA